MRICTTTIKTTMPLLAAAVVGTSAMADRDSGKADGKTVPSPFVRRNLDLKPPVDSGRPVIGMQDGGIAGGVPCSYVSDDGSAEDAIGLIAGGSFAWANAFTTVAGCTTIDEIQVSWDLASIANGTAVQLFVLSDPNQDGNPNDSNVLSTAAGVVSNSGQPGFVSYPVPTATVSGIFFIGARITHPAGQFAASLDNPPTPQDQPSWLALGFTDPADPFDSAPDANVLEASAALGFNIDWLLRAANLGNECLLPLPFCPEDIAPGGGDNVVGIADLLGVIGTFNQSAPAGPRPLGDVRPLPNGDCTVLIGDLLAVIGAWGVCPVPTGRCCTPAGTCSVTTEAACVTPNQYAGDFTTCATPCVAFPANDTCGGAALVPALVDGANNVNNSTATGQEGPDCTFGGAGNGRNDLFFRYTATCTGNLTIDTDATTGAVTDTQLEVLDACGGTQLACNDDIDVATNLLSSVTFQVTAGQQMIIRVSTFIDPATNVGPIVITIGCAVFDNDNCEEPNVITTLPASINGDLFGAAGDPVPACEGVTPTGAGRWYTVVGTGATMTASLCNSPNIAWDSGLSVYCGSSCLGLFCVTAEDSISCGSNFHETVSWCSAPGQVYRILVWDTSAAPAGSPGETDYLLEVSSAGPPCGGSATCGLANDDCAGATPVILGANNIDNSLATTSSNTGVPGGACVFNGIANFTLDLWFTFAVPGNFTGDLQVDTNATTGTVDDTVLQVFSGSCGSLTELACSDDDGPGLLSQATLTPTPGSTIIIRVGSWNNDAFGPIVLTLTNTTPTPPPAFDECGGAEALAIPGSDSVTVAGSGLTGNDQSPAPDDPTTTCELAVGGPFNHDASWWYVINHAGGPITISMCSTDPAQDCVLGLYSGTCGALTEVACDDDFCDAPNFSPSQIQLANLGAGQYFVLVNAYSGGYDAAVAWTITTSTP